MIGPTLPLALALLAAAPAAPEDVTLAAPPFETHGFSKKDRDVSFYSEHFAARLSANGIQVITPQQISSVKEMDKLRQLAGCSATSADCIIELGHMLGAQGVVRGTLAKVGETFQVDVRVYQSSDGKVLAARSVSARSNEGLVRALDQLALEVSGLIKAAFGIPTKPVTGTGPVVENPPKPNPNPPPPSAPPPPPLDLRPVAWIPAVGGLVAGVTGAGLLVLANFDRQKLELGEPTFTEAQGIRTRGEVMASVGTGLAIAGGASLLVAGGFALFGAPKQTAVTVVPGPAGAMVEVRFP